MMEINISPEDGMDIYDYAMKMERDGEAFYREIAAKTGHNGIRAIMTRLANAEVKHFHIFERMKAEEVPGDSDATVLEDIKTIFEKIRDEKDFKVDVAEIELYDKAKQIEVATRDFYVDRAGVVPEAQRAVFLKIAEEENRHFLILERVIYFVNKPQIWLENAEWYHLNPF